nr:Eukaryotic translation initiation factor 3 subunit J [Polyrhizophydium stewartii]
MESDFENAKALFGDLAVSGGIPKPEGAIELQEPKSRGEFDDFVKLVMKKFSTFEKMPQYTYFVESLVRELALPLSVDDTRKVTTSLNAMINEKQKALKDNKGKKKGAAKQSLKTEPSDSRDTTNYDDYNDDFDDFM